MPGVPNLGTPEFDAFALSFWAALYSGLIYSVVTGLAVGVTLLTYEAAVRRRAQRTVYEEDLAVLRQHLQQALSISEVFDLTCASSAVPIKAGRAMALIQDRPLAMWRAKVKRNRRLLDLLTELQVTTAWFRAAAESFDIELKAAVRRFNASEERIPSNDQTLVSYVLGSLCGLSAEEMAPWISLKGKEIPAWVRAGAEAISGNESLAQKFEAFSSARERLAEIAQELASDVGAAGTGRSTDLPQ